VHLQGGHNLDLGGAVSLVDNARASAWSATLRPVDFGARPDTLLGPSVANAYSAQHVNTRPMMRTPHLLARSLWVSEEGLAAIRHIKPAGHWPRKHSVKTGLRNWTVSHTTVSEHLLEARLLNGQHLMVALDMTQPGVTLQPS
jgi:hypothetical protein